jgi:hypothetical protein
MAGAAGCHPDSQAAAMATHRLSVEPTAEDEDMTAGEWGGSGGGSRPKTLTTGTSPSSMRRSVRIPSSHQLAVETPVLTWGFVIRCVRPEGLTPPSISGAFALLRALWGDRAAPSWIGSPLKVLVDGHFTASWSWGESNPPVPSGVRPAHRLSPQRTAHFRVSWGGQQRPGMTCTSRPFAAPAALCPPSARAVASGCRNVSWVRPPARSGA